MAAARAKSTSKSTSAWDLPAVNGKTFLFAGVRSKPWLELLEKSIAQEGGTIAKDVTGDLDYLVVGMAGSGGKGPSGAEKKAAALNQQGKASIQILDESGFKQLLTRDREATIALLQSGSDGVATWNERVFLDWLRIKYDLTGADFRNCDLSGAHFRNCTVNQCDFRGSKLSGTRFATVRDANFDGASGPACIEFASDCSFKGANFSSDDPGQISYLTAADSNFEGANLRNAHVMKLKNCTLRRLDAAGAHFVDKLDFSGADLTQANLENATAMNANFRNANLTKARLCGALLNNADFTGATLNGADFTDAIAVGAKLSDAQIKSAKGLNADSITAGKAGPHLQNLEQAAGQSQKLIIELRADLDSERYVQLTCQCWHGQWISGYATLVNGNNPSQLPGQGQGQGQMLSQIMLGLAKSWGAATPRFNELKVSASKSPLKNKELKSLAIAAWCEAFGIEIPTEEELKQQTAKAAEQSGDLREQALADLRSGSAGVAKWNQLSDAQRTAIGHMRKVDLNGADLREAILTNLDFQGAEFRKADLRGANFSFSDVKKSEFDQIKAQDSKFSGIKAADASFKNADLRKAFFEHASLLRADFSSANLTAAVLSFSDIKGATFAGGNLKNVTFRGTRFDEKTVFPDGFELPEDLVWAGQGKDPRLLEMVKQVASAGPIDFEQFMETLADNFDAARLKKAMQMLKAESFQLFAQVDDASVTGVVKSQSDADLVYSCRLDSEGTFACCTQNLNPCGGLRGALCKHLLVLLVGLTKGGELDPTTTNLWVAASKLQGPALDKDLMSEVFLKYKGAEAGEIDWRPTETVPEDYYAF